MFLILRLILVIIIIISGMWLIYKLFLEENCYSIEKNYLVVRKYERVCQKGVFGPKYSKKVEWKPFWKED
jgi:flagellar biogenesis protein FliO